MDTCTKGSSSNTDNAGKMNVSICETYINGCVSEPTKKWERDQKPNNFWTNEAVPSTTKKIMCACTKISGHRMIASDNLFWLDSYQDPIDLDSKPGQLLVSLENMQVGGLSHGKTTSQWKIQNKSLHKEVMTCNNKGRSFFDSQRCMMELSTHNKHSTDGELMSTRNRKYKNTVKTIYNNNISIS